MTKLERIIISWKPIAFVIAKSKKTFLPGFQHIAIYPVFLAGSPKIEVKKVYQKVLFRFLDV